MTDTGPGDGTADPLHPLAQALIDAHATIAPKIAQANTAHVVDLLETFEADMAKYIAPTAQRLLDDPHTPADIHPLLTALADPPHFGVSLAISFALGAILSPVIGAAFAPAVQGIENNAWAGNPSRPLSPDVLAAAVLKGVESEATAASEAGKSGLSPGAFGVMVDAAGNGVGIAEALLLYRRNQITADHLTEIMRYSNLNPRFYPDILKLRYGPPTAGEAIAGALKGHLTDADARTKLAESGIDPVNFEWLRATAGRPFSVGQAIELWNRGEISEARVDAVIAQSDVNPDFGADYKKLRVYYPPVRSIVPMLRSGAITEAQARDYLAKQGVPANTADAFVKEATTTKASAGKDLSQAQVVRLFGHQMITRADANTRLIALGYPAPDATLLLDAVADDRAERLQAGLISKVGALYIAYKLTKIEAVNALSSGQVPNAAQHDLFAAWDIERDIAVKVPTPSGIIGALRRNLITPAAAHRRLNALGVQDDDIVIFVGDGWPPSAPQDAKAAVAAVLADSTAPLTVTSKTAAKVRTLTPTQITKALVAGDITNTQAMTDLEALGYSAADAAELIALATPPPAVTP